MAILGICCAMRCAEFGTLKLEHVVDTNPQNHPDLPNRFVVSVQDAKKKVFREYTIADPYYNVIKNYIKQRPPDLQNLNFLVKYSQKQNIGKTTVGAGPGKIARFLELENCEKFKGHSWRRTAATWVANAGGTLLDVKQMGFWQSDAVAQRYIDHCPGTQLKLFNMLINSDLSEKKPADTTTEFVTPSMPKRLKQGSPTTPMPSLSKASSELPVYSSEQTSFWNEADDDWILDAANKSMFMTTAEEMPNVLPGTNNFTNDSTRQTTQNTTASSLPTKSCNRILKDQTANNAPGTTNSPPLETTNSATPPLKIQSNYKNVQSSMQSLLTDGSIIKFENCNIQNFTINNYISDKENKKPSNIH